jgi:hypothetical protein
LIYRPKENLKFKFFEKPPINAWGFFLFIPDSLCPLRLKFFISRLYALSSKTIPHFSESLISELKMPDFLPLLTAFYTISFFRGS